MPHNEMWEFILIELILVGLLLLDHFRNTKPKLTCKHKTMNDPKEKQSELEELKDDNFAGWLEDLEEKEQPTCNIDNPEDCEACGS